MLAITWTLNFADHLTAKFWYTLYNCTHFTNCTHGTHGTHGTHVGNYQECRGDWKEFCVWLVTGEFDWYEQSSDVQLHWVLCRPTHGISHHRMFLRYGCVGRSHWVMRRSGTPATLLNGWRWFLSKGKLTFSKNALVNTKRYFCFFVIYL